ncbi:uncharacterized protein HD556DRAFT_1410590 [Suillus plorans]|uniref:BCAS3 WD40 domain-containing protein n=1 Tax=Suillus plorans TaxID=116603 RepID=A0A9P7ADE3_9AGAM|nr:uncharacterized protein HD556DRAFT_1410590 [Suillus plorans]KAG1787184.1 hypothetical protein HD556DRAFT_1410590 [Suillus plorans]
MPSRKNRNATRQSPRTPVNNYSPAILPVDSNSPPWSTEQSPLVEPDRPPDSPIIQINLELPPVVAMEDESSPIKHDGGLLLATPESRPSPVRSEVKLPPTEDDFTFTPGALGHTRSPVLAREPTMLENFSRAVRNYVPTSIPVPASAPSPPRVSRPVSFGSFMAPPGASTSPKIPIVSPTARKPLGAGPIGNQQNWRMRPGAKLDSADDDEHAIFGSDDEDCESAFSGDQPLTTYPTAAEGDSIMWSRWDTLIENGSRPRRILLLGYTTGLQIWDCTILGSVSEILNLTDYPFGSVTFAGVLAAPHSSGEREYDSSRPLIGVVSRSKDKSTMSIYSLRAHKVIKHLPFVNVTTFTSSAHFIVISTTNPPTLHILSSASFTELHTISSLAILPSYTTIPYKANTNNIVSLTPIDSINTNHASHDYPAPIFALSHRILAYASLPPRADSHVGAVSQPRTRLRSPSSTLGISHAAALKVGGTVLSGVKSLGGIAYSAAAEYAKSRAGAGDQSRVAQGQTSVMSGVSNLFFSRSAPAASSGHSDPTEVTSLSPALFPNTQDRQEEVETLSSGYHITVLDLASLLSGDSPSVRIISEFVAFKHQPVSSLKFTLDGTSLLVSPRDGQAVRTFQIRPTASVLLPTDPEKYAGDHQIALVGRQFNAEQSSPWHMYNLRRGRTTAVIDGIEVSADGRWVAFGTRKATVHVFAINPYGGKPDLRSHMENRVRNTNEAHVPLSVELSSLVRLRSVKASAHGGVKPGITFTFLPSDTPLPASLQPPPSAITSSPSTSSSRSDQPSPLRARKTANFQDLLLFDPSDGVLSLRRIMLEQRPRDTGAFSYTLANLPTSMSLPGTSATGRLSTSPHNRVGVASTKTSGLTQMMLESASELHGRDTMIATWQLRRHRDWGEVKHVQRLNAWSPGRMPIANSLVHAELSTYSRSPNVNPRLIYLAHQFSFYTLGEDYHALIRRNRLDITGTKMDVRKEVEVSAYSAGTGESFVEGFSPRDMGRVASSFDEPIASAISADMEYPRSSRSLIPMLPNGAGLKPRSFKNPIPIRAMTSNIAEGVGEGFGRIRREINRVRSPQLVRPEGLSASVPLEFDEHDEDLVFPGMERDDDVVDDNGSRGEDATDPSIDTPPTDAELCDEGTELWHGWTEEDKLAVDEAEQFDDVVGFLDEEQTPAIQAEQRRANRKQLW